MSACTSNIPQCQIYLYFVKQKELNYFVVCLFAYVCMYREVQYNII